MPAAFSTITKSVIPARASWMPAQMPPGPAPITRTVVCSRRAAAEAFSLMRARSAEGRGRGGELRLLRPAISASRLDGAER
jgi:hypothetical protein